MKCKYATPQTNHLPFKELQNLKSPQSKNWACFNFNIWTIHRENKLPLNFLFLPILQSVNMQASYQLCKTTQHTNMNQKPTPYGNGNSIKKKSTITEMQAGNSANYMKQQFKKKKKTFTSKNQPYLEFYLELTNIINASS